MPSDDHSSMRRRKASRSRQHSRDSRSSSVGSVGSVESSLEFCTNRSSLPRTAVLDLRARAQRHHQEVHSATKEAMASEEDDCMVPVVSALDTDFTSLAQELRGMALGSASAALLAQLEAFPTELPLDQLIDLQRRHSVLGSILRLEDARAKDTEAARESTENSWKAASGALSWSVPDADGRSDGPSTPRAPSGWPSDCTLSSSAATIRRNRPNLPPLGVPQSLQDKTMNLARSDSRASRGSRASSRGSRVSRASSRARSSDQMRKRSSSVRSLRSAQSASSVRIQSATAVRAHPGPAAVGLREMSVEEMKAEIQEERKQYIAERL